MEQNFDNTKDAFMDVAYKKIEQQDKKMAAWEEQLKDLAGNKILLRQLITVIESLKEDVAKNQLPFETLEELSKKLNINNVLLKLGPQKVQHHHHVPKLIWIAAGLFLGFAMVCSGWYVTHQKLEQFVMNDTKYRYLKLDTGQRPLMMILDRVDRVYDSSINMRKDVLDKEEVNRKNFEKLQKAEQLKEEAKDLEKSVKIK